MARILFTTRDRFRTDGMQFTVTIQAPPNIFFANSGAAVRNCAGTYRHPNGKVYLFEGQAQAVTDQSKFVLYVKAHCNAAITCSAVNTSSKPSTTAEPTTQFSSSGELCFTLENGNPDDLIPVTVSMLPV